MDGQMNNHIIPAAEHFTCYALCHTILLNHCHNRSATWNGMKRRSLPQQQRTSTIGSGLIPWGIGGMIPWRWVLLRCSRLSFLNAWCKKSVRYDHYLGSLYSSSDIIASYLTSAKQKRCFLRMHLAWFEQDDALYLLVLSFLGVGNERPLTLECTLSFESCACSAVTPSQDEDVQARQGWLSVHSIMVVRNQSMIFSHAVIRMLQNMAHMYCIASQSYSFERCSNMMPPETHQPAA